jgi:hypothetical protein
VLLAVSLHHVHAQQIEKQRDTILATSRNNVFSEARELPTSEFPARFWWLG